jgi:hypothetical protein
LSRSTLKGRELLLSHVRLGLLPSKHLDIYTTIFIMTPETLTSYKPPDLAQYRQIWPATMETSTFFLQHLPSITSQPPLPEDDTNRLPSRTRLLPLTTRKPPGPVPRGNHRFSRQHSREFHRLDPMAIPPT